MNLLMVFLNFLTNPNITYGDIQEDKTIIKGFY